MLHFQYITSMYGSDLSRNVDTVRYLNEWLRINVGKQGDARDTTEDFDWAWSLTSYLIPQQRSTPNRDWTGIYFKRPEDRLRFRLTFDVYDDKRDKYSQLR